MISMIKKGIIKDNNKNIFDKRNIIGISYRKIFKLIFNKRVVTFIMALAIICETLFSLSFQSFAATKKTYRYVFDMGCDSYNESYVYEIITKEPVAVKVPSDIELISSSFTNVVDKQKYPNLLSGESGKTNLLDYISACSEYNDENSPLVKKAVKTFKKIVFATVEDGTYKIWAKGNKEDIQYCKKDNSGVPDSDFPKYSWGKWTEKEGGFLGIGAKNKTHNFGEYVLGYSKSGMRTLEAFARNEMSIKEGDNAKRNYLSFMCDDINIAYIVTKSIKAGNDLGFIKEEQKAKQPIEVGNHTIEPNKESIDEKNGTMDVDVYRTVGGKKQKVLTFRYKKGGLSGLSTSTKTNIHYVQGTTSNIISNSYFLVDKTDQASVKKFDSYSTFNTYPEVVGSTTVNSLDHRFDKKKNCLLFNSNNAVSDIVYESATPYMEDGIILQQKGPFNLKTSTAYAAVSTSNQVCIVYAIKEYLPGKQEPYLRKSNILKEYADVVTEVIAPKEENLSLDDSYYGFAPMYKAISVDYSNLDAYFSKEVKSEIDTKLQSGNWTLEYDKKNQKLYAYNTPGKGEGKKYFIMDFDMDTYYKVYYDYNLKATANGKDGANGSLFMGLLKNEDETKPNNSAVTRPFYETGTFGNQYGAFLFTNKVPGSSSDKYNDKDSKDEKNQTPEKMDKEAIKHYILAGIANTDGFQVSLRFYDIMANNESRRGEFSGANSRIKVTSKNLLKTSSGSIISFDITPWLAEKYKKDLADIKKSEIAGNRKSIGFESLSREELESLELDFYKLLFKYSKPIIMFLIFIMVLWIGIYSVMVNQDAKARVLVKEKLKHIVVGAIMFSSIVAILFLCKSFMDNSFKKIQEVSESNIDVPFEVPDPDYDDNWLVDLIVSLINAVADIAEWVISKVMSKLIGDGDVLSLSKVIFNQGDGVDKTLAPFTVDEWNRYMYGYQALQTLAIALLAVAIVKFAMEMVIHAGNSERIAETKQTCLRIMIAMLAIVLGPYAVRLMLTLFNNLILLVPTRNMDLDLSFADPGIVGAIANLLFVWTKFKIYLVFLVRKLMITFMLLITPVVFGLWAISNKFRSMSLWVGELFTNCATQLCYALVFFVASVILITSQNDFVILIMVMMFIQLADFFKDSLQGLVQKWGGINETGEAEKMASGIKSWGKKTWSKAKGYTKKTGSFMAGAADYIDPDKISNTARHFRNAGNIMQGNILNVQSKSQMTKNISKVMLSKKDEETRLLRYYDNNARRSNDQNYKDYYNKVRSGTVSLEESRKMAEAMGPGSIYEDAHAANEAMRQEARYEKGFKDAKSESKAQRNFIDRAKKNIENKSLDEYDTLKNNPSMTGKEFKEMSQHIAKTYEQGRTRLAEKSADIDAFSKLNSEGKIDEEQLLKCCSEAIRQAEELERAGKNVTSEEGFNNNVIQITNNVRQQVNRVISDIPQDKQARCNELIANKFNNLENVNDKAMSNTPEVDKHGNPTGRTMSDRMNDASNSEDGAKFDDVKNKRYEILKESFNIK